MAYDFDNFLSSVKYLDKQDILDAGYQKHKVLDKHTTAYTTAERLEFQRCISDLLFWMETGHRPKGISDQEFAKFKFICENLVKKRQIDKAALEAFK